MTTPGMLGSQLLPSGYRTGDIVAVDARQAAGQAVCTVCGKAITPKQRIASLTSGDGDAHTGCIATMTAPGR